MSSEQTLPHYTSCSGVLAVKNTHIMTNTKTTLEEMLNSDLISGEIQREDEELKNAGWTIEEIRRFAKFLIKTNK